MDKVVGLTLTTVWYQSWYFFLVCFLVAALILYVYHRRQKYLLDTQKKDILLLQQSFVKSQTEKHNHEVDSTEQKQFKNEIQTLKDQLKIKTVELANKSKESDEKNRIIISLKEKFEDAQKSPDTAKKRWIEIKKLLDDYLDHTDNVFEIQIDELHQELFDKLRDISSELSVNDLRLCAYLKSGLSSKEIASILNILPSSVFISRSRLRKKLSLPNEEDLYNFLRNL